MTAALEGGEWSAGRPGHTLPPGKTRYPFYRRLGGPQGQSGRAENVAPHRESIPDHPARSLLPHRLSYPAHRKTFNNNCYVRNYLVIVVKYILTITGKCNWTLFILRMNNQLHACSLSTWTVYHGTHHQADVCVRISMRKLHCTVKIKINMNKWKKKYISALALHQLPWLVSFWSFHSRTASRNWPRRHIFKFLYTHKSSYHILQHYTIWQQNTC